MSEVTIDILKQICKNVKIHVHDDQLIKIQKDIQNLVTLAEKINEINVDINNVSLKNFSFQDLPLLEEPLTTEKPIFQRETINNMIVVPKFVNKED